MSQTHACSTYSDPDTTRKTTCKEFDVDFASVSYYMGSTMKNYYDGRFGGSRFWNMKADRYSEDEQGMVGGHEQSHYG